ncbi:hypothetical protein Tco_0144498 [Tanacetum coccineum]
MEALKFVDSHNMVAYMEKSTENADFDEIVDFLNVNPIRYALTVSPTIYVSYIEQFWSTTKIEIVNNERQIRAKVNGKTIVILESSVRRVLQFNDEDDTPTTASPSNIEPILIIASSSQPQKTHKRRKTKRPTEISQSSGPTTLVADETVHEDRGDSMERAATTTANLDAEQDNGVNTPGSREDRLKIIELMEICTKLSDKGRNIAESDQDEEISFVQEDVKTQGRYDHDIDVTTVSAPITTAGVSVSSAEPSTPPTTTTVIEDEDLTIDQTLMQMISKKSKEKAKERGSKETSSKPATRPTRGVTMKEPSESKTRKAVPLSQHDLKDKGKPKMIKPEKPLKKKDQIKFDEEVAKRLAEELEVELEEEERVTIQREEEANLISWDNTQAMMGSDYELA